MKATLAFLLLLTSCGTMFNGGPDTLAINTRPPGAVVTLDGTDVGITPTTVSVERTAGGRITLTKAGYQPQSFRLTTHVNGSAMVNFAWILFWPVLPIAFLTDGVSGNLSVWDAPATVTLARIGGA